MYLCCDVTAVSTGKETALSVLWRHGSVYRQGDSFICVVTSRRCLIRDSKIGSWVLRDLDQRVTALARTGSNCTSKLQIRPLAREGGRIQKPSIVTQKAEIWSGARHQDSLADWPSVVNSLHPHTHNCACWRHYVHGISLRIVLCTVHEETNYRWSLYFQIGLHTWSCAVTCIGTHSGHFTKLSRPFLHFCC
jgi:uncharacterized Zn-binding protein involved in type VI secretion